MFASLQSIGECSKMLSQWALLYFLIQSREVVCLFPSSFFSQWLVMYIVSAYYSLRYIFTWRLKDAHSKKKKKPLALLFRQFRCMWSQIMINRIKFWCCSKHIKGPNNDERCTSMTSEIHTLWFPVSWRRHRVQSFARAMVKQQKIDHLGQEFKALIFEFMPKELKFGFIQTLTCPIWQIL